MSQNPKQKEYQSERADLYFQRRHRRGTIPIYIAAAVICALFAVMNMKAGHSPVYFIVAVFFFGMAVWQFFYTKKAVVDASEVDDRFNKIYAGTELTVRAATESELYLDDFEALDKYVLTGYTKEKIKDTEAVLRADRADKTARSSHMQMSCLALDKYSLISFTIKRSLIELKEESDNMFWPYTQISDVAIEKYTVPCPLDPGSEETSKREFCCVRITSKELKETQRFAFNEDCRKQAEEFVQIIRSRSDL